MVKVSLKVNKREITGKKVKTLRAKNQIPLVLYGHGFKAENLDAAKNAFVNAYQKAGSSNLVDLEIDKQKPVKVLIQDVQTNPISDEIIHADLYRVRKDRKLRTQIPLHFTGKSRAVEDKEGNLITHKDSIEVEVLPDDLIDEIKVDISPLKTFEETIKISDLDIPQGIEVLDEKEDIVANVTPPRSEEELEALEEEVEEDVDAVEVEKEKKAEGEEAVEGEEATTVGEGKQAPAEATSVGEQSQIQPQTPAAPEAKKPEQK
ncbi:50S ribosomal protein L25 [Patescibacteria group bacterium]|nr:50S ribosomal protein L25 [Patescibacteria group bacterium]